LRLTDEILDATEYIPLDEEGVVKDREVAWLNGQSDEEEEESFDWVDPKRNEDKDKFDSETFFTLVNETRRTMKKGEQAWNCYGNRTNLYLLVNYGFCFQNNLYDSLSLNFRLDIDLKGASVPSVKDMIPSAKE
jgi:hypothetical protein